MGFRYIVYHPLLRTESRAAGAFNQKVVEGVVCKECLSLAQRAELPS